jgi:hypothetical protein
MRYIEKSACKEKLLATGGSLINIRVNHLSMRSRKGLLPRIRARWRNRKALRHWEHQGKPAPPPHIVKQIAVREYAKEFRTQILVETGTYLGEMVAAMRRHFDRIFSIEIDRSLYENALNMFSQFQHIRLLHGDSAEALPAVLSEVQQPCLFWLDGHYSGAGTGKGSIDTPVLNELSHIFSHHVREHVILIDDAREFRGVNDYPSLEQLREFVKGFRPDWAFEVKDDIIRIHPYRRNSGR